MSDPDIFECRLNVRGVVHPLHLNCGLFLSQAILSRYLGVIVTVSEYCTSLSVTFVLNTRPQVLHQGSPEPRLLRRGHRREGGTGGGG